MDIVLDPIEARVLGSLLEKERAVPATYPLTMNALLTACNQSTSRHPVMDLSEAQVTAAIESLKAMKLVRRVLPSHGNRVTKYRQVADEALAVDDAQRAVVTMLLLRGPQTPTELRARTERLHRFAHADQVEAVLADMAGWGHPLVRLLPRQPGQREARWAHLLSGEPTEAGPVAGAGSSSLPPPVSADAGPTSTGPGAAPGSAPLPTRSAMPVVDPSLHGPLAALVGTWVGQGEGRYPTMDDVSYTEQIEIVPLPGKPLLSYRSATQAVDDGRALHAESGFFRLVGGEGVELVVAAGPGIVEGCSGVVERAPSATEVLLASEVVAGTSTARSVTATERTYRVAEDVLSYEMSMAVDGGAVLPHLRGRLHRV